MFSRHQIVLNFFFRKNVIFSKQTFIYLALIKYVYFFFKIAWQFWSINLWNFREIFAMYDACRVLWLCVTNNYRYVSNYILSVVWNWKKLPVFLCWMYTSTLYINLHHSCLRSYFRVISVLTIPVLMQPRKLCRKRTHISEIRVVR